MVLTENGGIIVSRIMCLDVGEKRIGVAVSDSSALVALPVQVLNRVSLEKDLENITDLIDHYRAKVLVIGYPKHLNGSPSKQSLLVDEFIAGIAPKIQVQIERWDERLTTRAAEKDLIRAGLKRKSRRRVIDAAAAALILQNYLDSKR